MLRKSGIAALLGCLALMPSVLAAPSHSAKAAAGQFGSTGTWGFCASDTQVGCVEGLYLTGTDGVTTLVNSSAGLTETNVTMNVSCSVAGGMNESGVPYTNPKPDSCDPTNVVGQYYGCDKYSLAIISASVTWKAGVGGSVAAVFRTGDFEPAFSLGAGITNAQILKTSAGQFKYVWKSQVDLIHKIPSETAMTSFGGSSVATATQAQASLAIFPKTAYYGSAYAYSSTPVIGTGDCVQRPIEGSWASANAQAFSAEVMLGKRSHTPNLVNTFRFTAYGPHFKDPTTVNGSRTSLNSAYMRVFLAPAFLDSIGCANQCDQMSTALSITTADGQTAAPTFTKFEEGYLVNLGIDHYSAPNPVVTASKIGEPLVVQRDWKSTTTIMPTATRTAGTTASTVPAPVNSGTRPDRTVKAKVKSRTGLARIFTANPKYKVKWTVSGGCRLSGSTLIARSTKGSCVLTLVEKSGTTVKRTRTAKITVS